MSLEVLDVVKNGLKETFSSTGLKLIGALYLLNLVSQVANQSLMAQGLVPTAAETATPLALSMVPTTVWLGTLAVLIAANIALSLGTLRNFVNKRFDELETSYFTENLAWPALNMIAGSIVFGIIVAAGTLAFIIPGIFLFVSLLFWQVYVAVEDENFIDALKNSWNLTQGNRIDLFLVGFGVIGVSLLASLIVGVPGALLRSVSPAAGTLLSMVSATFTTVFSLATLAHAYNELQ